jgi:hypothetical protein
MSRTDRHAALAWADQLDAQRRAAAHPRIPGATRLQLAIVQHLTHPAAALADCGTESLCDQVLTAPGLLFDNVGTEAELEQVLGQPTRHHTGHPATPQERHTMPDGHHLPAALTQPGDLPPPIPFPDRPAKARAIEPSESTRQRWARMGKLIDTAKAEGHATGLRQGYTQGWRWGLLQGVAIGALLASLAWAVWLTVNAPQAAPPSATQSHLSSRG